MKYSGLILLLSVAMAAMVLPSAAIGAEIAPTDQLDCRLILRGELRKGDFEKFAAAAQASFPGNDGESTSKDVICLDSPGGNLSEGVRFARHFYEQGVGTRIDDGASCYSSCAIMFMMGMAQGDEVRFVNRKLHVGGALGFHRPFLAPNLEGRIGVSADDLATVYDVALQSALDLLEMANRGSPWANEPMMMPDLVQRMLAHVGDDLFLIDNVDRAARFKIEVVGLPTAPALTEESAFYACENGLQWQVGLTEEDIRYSNVLSGSSGYQRVKRLAAENGAAAYAVEGLASGYAREGCIVTAAEQSIKACGLDEYTGVELGEGECGEADYRVKVVPIHPLAAYYPWTKLESLRSPTPAAATTTAYRCVVLRGSQTLDDEECGVTIRSSASPDWPSGTIAHFMWPSGAKTVVQRSGSRIEVNGARTYPREDPQHGTCFRNGASGNDFCVRAVTR